MKKVNFMIGGQLQTTDWDQYVAGSVRNELTNRGLGDRRVIDLKDRCGLLTDRQGEVYDQIIEGLTQKEIAEKLTMDLKTVKFHTTTIFRILGVSSRARLQALVYQTELANV